MFDSTLAEAHASLGFVHLFYDWDFDAASRELGRAIALDSTYATAFLWRHQLDWARGDTAAMLADMKKAVDLEPLSPILATRYGGALLRAGRRKDAAAQFRRTIEIDSTFAEVRGYLGTLMIREGNVVEGLREIERTRDPFRRAVAYAQVGRRDDALRLVHEIEASSRGGSWVSPLRIAQIYGALGETDSALEWLERAFTARDPDLVFLASDGVGKIPSTDPRLRAFTSRMGSGGGGAVR